MSDLVERLRGFYSQGPFGKRDFSPYVPPICNEAADEIEALQCHLAISKGKHENAIAEIERLRARVAELDRNYRQLIMTVSRKRALGVRVRGRTGGEG